MVTIEDLAEALVGPIRQEPEPGGERGTSGGPQADRDSVETVGGCVIASMGGMPEEGDEVPLDERVLHVEALDGLRVEKVRVLLAGPNVGEGEGQVYLAELLTHPRT